MMNDGSSKKMVLAKVNPNTFIFFVFQIPNWILMLPDPSIEFDLDRQRIQLIQLKLSFQLRKLRAEWMADYCLFRP